MAERISSVESREDGDFPTAVTELSQNRSHCTGQNLLSETGSEATRSEKLSNFPLSEAGPIQWLRF